MEPLEELRDALGPAGAVAHVGGDTHVREERILLEHQPDRASLRRQVEAPGGVEPHLVAESDRAALRPKESCHDSKHGRFAGARGADESQRPRRRLEGQLEAEPA